MVNNFRIRTRAPGVRLPVHSLEGIWHEAHLQISVDRLTLRGRGPAAISGGAGAAVTVESQQGVALSGLTISGAQGAGVLARDAAQITLTDVNIIGIELSAPRHPLGSVAGKSRDLRPGRSGRIAIISSVDSRTRCARVRRG